MENVDLQIGNRIRLEREARGWTLAQLAEHSGVSRSMIHKIEHGDSSPTAVVLGKLSGAFGLTISTLIARAEQQKSKVSKRADQPFWRDPETGYLRWHVSPSDSDNLELVEVELPAGKRVPMPASSYSFLDQMIWVLEGELCFFEGAISYEMTKGDCLHIGQNEDCIFANTSTLPCRYAVFLSTKK